MEHGDEKVVFRLSTVSSDSSTNRLISGISISR